MLDDIKVELEKLLASAPLRALHPRDLRAKGRIKIRGRELTDFTNWDVLNLGSHPKLKRAVQVEIEHNGLGCGSSRAVAGTTHAHLSCESFISRFLNRESSLLFASKNQAVLSVMTAFFNESDVILAEDTLSSPVSDCAYLINARFVPFSTDQIDLLDQELSKHSAARRRCVFAESLCGVSARRLEVQKLLSTVERHGAYLCVDESYSVGLTGLRGAGSSEKVAPSSALLIQYGDLGLGLGAYGAFVTGSKGTIALLTHRSRTLSLEGAIPAALAAAIQASLEIAETELALRKKCAELATRLATALLGAGLIVGSEFDSPLISVQFSSLTLATEIAEALFQRGHLIEIVPRGTLRDNTAYLRIVVHSDHSEKDIDSIASDLSEIVRRAK